jgi:hypothetical protein
VKYSVLNTQELGNFTIYSISRRMQNDVQIYQYYKIRTKLKGFCHIYIYIYPYIYIYAICTLQIRCNFFEFSILVVIAPSK